MTLIDTSSLLDTSTALGAVLSVLLALFPAGSRPIEGLSFSSLASLGALLGLTGMVLRSLWINQPPRPSSHRLVILGAASISLLWCVFVLGADGVLAAHGLPRLSHAALAAVPAFMVGVTGAHLALPFLLRLFDLVGQVLSAVFSRLHNKMRGEQARRGSC